MVYVKEHATLKLILSTDHMPDEKKTLVPVCTVEVNHVTSNDSCTENCTNLHGTEFKKFY